jgi:hypothetical protein
LDVGGWRPAVREDSRADPADRVAVVADEPLEAAGRDHLVEGPVAAVLGV